MYFFLKYIVSLFYKKLRIKIIVSLFQSVEEIINIRILGIILNRLLQIIHLSPYLLAELKQIINPFVQRNGFFGQTENMLVAMITNESKHIYLGLCELGLHSILKTSHPSHRSKKNPNQNSLKTICGVWKFTIPVL